MPNDTTYPEARFLEAFPWEDNGEPLIALRDPEALFDGVLVVSPFVYRVLCALDGSHTLQEIIALLGKEGIQVDQETLQLLLDQLDQKLCLEGARVEEARREVLAGYHRSEARPAAHAGGAYPEEPQALKDFLQKFFLDPAGPGSAAPAPDAPKVRGIVAPHIDFHRGNVAYAWAYHDLAREPSPPEVFVILGTSHHPLRRRFALTRKGYATPVGTLKNDRPLLEAIERRLGGRFFDDEAAHRMEHSVEFQAVMLAHTLGEERATILPVLCGSIHDLIGKDPSGDAAIGDFVSALKEEIARDGRRVCLVAGVDLAHIGPRFGDRKVPDREERKRLEEKDRATLAHICAGDAAAFFADVARDRNARRICGFAPLYSFLRVLEGEKGKLLHYNQATSPPEGSIVSYASAVFTAPR